MRDIKLATKYYSIKNDEKAKAILMATTKNPDDFNYEGTVFLQIFAGVAFPKEKKLSLEELENRFFEYITNHSEKELIDKMYVRNYVHSYASAGMSSDTEELWKDCRKLDIYDEY